MGCHHVDVAGIDPAPDRLSVQRSISDAVGPDKVAANRYYEDA